MTVKWSWGRFEKVSARGEPLLEMIEKGSICVKTSTESGQLGREPHDEKRTAQDRSNL